MGVVPWNCSCSDECGGLWRRESSGQGPEKVSEEKRLTVYTSHKQEVYAPIIKEFEERTGIW